MSVSHYDEIFSEEDYVPDEAVQLLASLAQAGPVLELGVGTGRLALKLASRGLSVTGIDISEHALDALRQKPGSSGLRLIHGDLVEVDWDGKYQLIYGFFGVMELLRSQDRQLSCVQTAARHLRPGGILVINSYVPNKPGRIDSAGQVVRFRGAGPRSVNLTMAKHDVGNQRSNAYILNFSDRGPLRIIHSEQRYLYPSELRLMAMLAGIHFESCWGSWQGQAYEGGDYVAVLRKPAE